MADIYADVIRVCTTAASMNSTLKEKMLGFQTDDYKLQFKAPGGTGYYYAAEGQPADYSDVTIDDYIAHDGDADTYVGFGAADTFSVHVGGNEHVKIDTTELLISHATVPKISLFEDVDDTTSSIIGDTDYMIFVNDSNYGGSVSSGFLFSDAAYSETFEVLIDSDSTVHLNSYGDLELTGNDITFDGDDVIASLGDAAGTNKFSVEDSGATEVAYIDSDGNADFSGNVQVDGNLNADGYVHSETAIHLTGSLLGGQTPGTDGSTIEVDDGDEGDLDFINREQDGGFRFSRTDPNPDQTILQIGTDNLGQDVFTVAKYDYSGSSTINGWSGTPTSEIYCKRVGNTCHVWFRIVGTGSGTAANAVNFTVPWQNDMDDSVIGAARTVDNSTANAGYCTISDNSSTMYVYKQYDSTATWTDAVNRYVQGYICYETNDAI